MTYIATIHGSDISRAPELRVETGDLTVAKRAATKRFGDGFRHHEIVIYYVGREGDGEDTLVTSRPIHQREWIDRARF